MADFKIKSDAEQLRLIPVTIATGEVIEAGDLVEMASGLPVKATATGAKVAYAPIGSASGETTIFLSVGNDFVLLGNADAVFAVAQKGTEVDLVVNSTVQLIDVGASSTDVFVVSPREDAGVVGSASNIQIRINYGKAIF